MQFLFCSANKFILIISISYVADDWSQDRNVSCSQANYDNPIESMNLAKMECHKNPDCSRFYYDCAKQVYYICLLTATLEVSLLWI